MPYFIYVLKCSDGTLYTGSTNDLKKRLSAHNTSKAAAKYTRGRRPVTIVYSEKLRTKSQALEREAKEVMAQMDALTLELDPLYTLSHSPEKSEKVEELHKRMEALKAQFDSLWNRKIAILEQLDIR